MKRQILLLCGGGGAEHDVSLVSAEFFRDQLAKIPDIETHWVEIGKDGIRRDDQGNVCALTKDGEIKWENGTVTRMNFAIPCFHGYPGETGDIQAVFDLMNLPYLGSNHEASLHCFNKVTTKLWMDAIGIPNSAWEFLIDTSGSELKKAEAAFDKWGDVFVKASNQGSSVGAYHVTDKKDLVPRIMEAFKLSPYVLIEQTIRGRELELAVYQFNDEIQISKPGEIICHGDFYSYEEKYSKTSTTETPVEAKNISPQKIQEMQGYALRLFKGLKLRHLARVDFFLSADDQVYLNEPNTFPGHTPISMFPMMMEHNGHDYPEFLKQIIAAEARD